MAPTRRSLPVLVLVLFVLGSGIPQSDAFFRDAKRQIGVWTKQFKQGSANVAQAAGDRFVKFKVNTDATCRNDLAQSVSELTSQVYNTKPWCPKYYNLGEGQVMDFKTYNGVKYQWKLMKKFSSDGMGDCQGGIFKQVSPPAKRIALVFRGSESARDWINNFSVDTHFYNQCPGNVKVHSGFMRAWKSVKEGIFTYLNNNLPEGYELVVSGHSLGAAMATIASFEIKKELPIARNVRPLLFAAPQVGKVGWAACYNDALPNAVRYENWFSVVNCWAKAVYSRDTVTNVLDKFGFDSVGTQCKLECGFKCNKRCCSAAKELPFGILCHSTVDYTDAFVLGHKLRPNAEKDILKGFAEMSRI